MAASVGSNGSTLGLMNIKAPKNGYTYIYISNRSNQDVYFDNLQVGITAGNIIEKNHYYAYGLKIAGISSKKLGNSYEGSLKNNYLYNDKELFDDADLSWYDYGFRNYDPQIGRFTQLDPLTWDYPELTPFQFAGCEPIANVDVDGLEPKNVVKLANDLGKQGYNVSTKLIEAGANAGKWAVGFVDKLGVAHSTMFAVKSASWGTRLMGVLKALGGLMEMIAGGVGGTATSWTGIGAVAGGAAVVHGADVTASGFTQMWTGEKARTLTEQGVSKGLQAAGISKNKADVVAGYVDMSLSIGFTAGSGAARDATFVSKKYITPTANGGSKIIRSVGADINRAEKVLQTGGNTLSKSTLKALNLTKEQGKAAIEGLKKFERFQNNFHGKIMGNGDVIHPNTGEFIGNLFDYVPKKLNK